MSVKLNLLPLGSAIPPSLGKVLGQIRTVAIVAISLFLFFVLGVSGYLVYSQIRLQTLTAGSDNLKLKIKERETTEQKIILLKDRLGKITIARASPSIQKNTDNAGVIADSLPEGTILTELSIDQKKTDISLVFGSSAGLNLFLDSVPANSYFKRATLTAFSFNPQTGYSIGLRLFEK